jgi:hypothetical protein
MRDQERSHARVLRHLMSGSLRVWGVRRWPGSKAGIGRLGATPFAQRSSVLGANDGLTSNLALVTGVAVPALRPGRC